MPIDANAITFESLLPREDHARLVMAWRNDPHTLQASFHQTPKVWDSFWDEFQRHYLTTPALWPLFALYQGQRVAFLRFRSQGHPLVPARRCCELSINVAPAWRGKGIATAALQAAGALVAARGYNDIYAEVKEDNVASQKVFARAGFTKIDTVPKHVDEKTFAVGRYLAALTPPTPTENKRVFIVAEAGSNWRVGSPQRDEATAKALINVAAEAGVDAVKFQVFRAHTVYVENAGASDYLAEAGIKRDICALYQNLAMPYEMVPLLAEYCRNVGVQFMASPFSKEDFNAVDPYVDVHKIASYTIGHLRLLQLIGRSQKPTILSTGAATDNDIAWAVDTFFQCGGTNLTLLQCTAKYPADPETMNLRAIAYLKERYGVDAGLSDHSTHPTLAPVAAVALGATVVEKHYTLDKDLPGPDHAFAVTPSQLKTMVQAIRATEEMLGSDEKTVMPAEEELRNFAHRGIQAIRPVAAGEELREGFNVDILRPGKQRQGIHPKHITAMEGKPATRDIAVGDGIQFPDFQG